MKQTTVTILLNVWILFTAMQMISCKNNNSTDKPTRQVDEQAIITQIIKMERERLATGVSKNLAVFDSATADDYLQIDFDGQVLNKSAMLERIKSSYAQLRSNELDDMVVRVYGNTAIFTGRANPRGIMKGKEFTDSVRYTRVYVNREGRWKVVLFHQTRINPTK